MDKVAKAAREHQKGLRKARKVKKGDEAKTVLMELVEKQAEVLKAKPHPNFPDRTLLDYCQWIIQHSSAGGLVFAVKRIKHLASIES